MEEKVNLIKKIYDIVENASKTKFGSAVIGFTLASFIACAGWFIVVTLTQLLFVCQACRKHR